MPLQGLYVCELLRWLMLLNLKVLSLSVASRRNASARLDCPYRDKSLRVPLGRVKASMAKALHLLRTCREHRFVKYSCVMTPDRFYQV